MKAINRAALTTLLLNTFLKISISIPLQLPISGRHIVSCGEPKHTVHGILLAYVLDFLANHDAELNLPVQLLSDAGQGKVTARSNHTGGKLVEDQRLSWDRSSLGSEIKVNVISR